jgi:ketosteroid isomerase-like protein
MSTNPEVQLVRKMYDLLEGGEIDGMLQLLDEDVVIDERIGPAPYAGVYHGHQGFRDLTSKMFTDFEFPSWVLGDPIVGSDGTAVAVNRLTIRSRKTGRDAELLCLEMFRIRDGKIVEVVPRYDGHAVGQLTEPLS